MGFKEVGIHSGADFDLKAHEGIVKLQFFDTVENKSYVLMW